MENEADEEVQLVKQAAYELKQAMRHSKVKDPKLWCSALMAIMTEIYLISNASFERYENNLKKAALHYKYLFAMRDEKDEINEEN
jgi:hypothetical protein